VVHQGEILAMKKEVDAFSPERNVQYLTSIYWHTFIGMEALTDAV